MFTSEHPGSFIFPVYSILLVSNIYLRRKPTTDTICRSTTNKRGYNSIVTTYVEATYLGDEGIDFHTNQTYQLRIVQHWTKKMTVTATHGYEFKPIEGMQRTYGNLKDLLIEWHILRVASGQSMVDF